MTMTLRAQNAGDLAFFGGPPAFDVKLHVGRPNIGARDRLLERLNDIIDRRWLTNNGVYVREFETRVASLLGVKHCIAMCNGTVALEITIRALGLTGEVLVPSMTFVATAHALEWQAITPVFCDIDPETLTLDPADVERRVTPRTSGIIGVHLFGRACDVGALEDIAARRGLQLMFDASHAFGASHQGALIGRFGAAEVFSFHATKFVNTLEGGAVTTNDDDLAAKIRLMKNFGFAGYDDVRHVGTNGKMNEFSAAMGLTSLEDMDAVIAVNRANHALYRQQLAGLPGVTLRTYNEAERNNYQYIVLQIDADATGIHRDDIVRLLHAENIIARRYFHPGCHRMEPYRSRDASGMDLPVTERVTEQVLSLPTGTAVDSDDIGKVCDRLRHIALNGPALSRRMRSGTEGGTAWIAAGSQA